jgi:Tfp pilus assembly protein FimV
MVTIPYWLIRYGLPAGFLLLATVAILVARSAIHDEQASPAVRPPAPPPARSAPRRAQTRSTSAPGYSVRSGDTLGAIADRLGTTVDELLALNPGIDPRALRVGQTLRLEQEPG